VRNEKGRGGELRRGDREMGRTEKGRW